MKRSSKSLLGRTYDYNYVNSKLSLPCLAEECKCCLFSNFFDNYDDEIKIKL